MLNKNKRAGIGEAITWVVATIIIMVVLAIFIFAANAMGTYRSYTVSSGEVKVNLDSQIITKTELAFEKSEETKTLSLEEKEKIVNWIEEVKK